MTTPETVFPDRRAAASDLGGVAGVLMNLTVYPLLILLTVVGIVLFPFAFALWKGVTGWSTGRIVRHFIWLYGRGWMAIVSPFVRFRREGLASGAATVPGIIVVNHLSFFDTYCMGLLPFFDVTFAVRSWPFRMFWYAGFMRMAGYLDVESMPWEECREAGRRVLESGGHLLFFPEGHRSRDGELQRFYSGAFHLAHELGAPLIPLCIDGTDRLLPPGRRWLRPARVQLRALPAVDPADFSDHRALRRHVKGEMARALAEMRREGRG